MPAHASGTPDVRALTCSDHLKEIIYRCIGSAGSATDNAQELVDALKTRPAPLKTGVSSRSETSTWRSRHPLAKRGPKRPRPPREPAAIVHGAPSSKTPSSCAARPNPLAGRGREGGLKLMESTLRGKGQRIIRCSSEAQFWEASSPRADRK
jgi:hypothetical protein